MNRMNSTRVYLDNAATTPLLPPVRVAMEPFLNGSYGNASSPYAVAREARMALDGARTQVARLLGANADEIAWTGSGTEADNWALWGVALANFEAKGHFLVSAIEHHAVLEPAQTLRELGFEVEFVQPNSQGVVEPDEIARLMRPDTRLVSLMSCNNEIGVLQPVADVARVCRDKGVLFHVDATQSAGKEPLDVDFAVQNGANGGCDLMTISAHKIGGPKGAGALYIRRGTKMKPLLRGGAQERGRRAGTENVAAIAGFGEAARIALEGLSANSARLELVRARLETALRELPNVEIVAENAPRAPHICSFLARGKRAESLALGLDLRGFAVGTGSACASGALEPSHVLAAMGFSRDDARSVLRVSLSQGNTEDDVDEFVGELKRLLLK